MKIVIGASMSFYKHVSEVKQALEQRGYEVLVPLAVPLMEQDRNYDVKQFFANHYGTDYDAKKAEAIRDHFDKISRSDVLLVVNDHKHELDGYIGGNVLMEMGLAFYLRKPIYLLSPIPQGLPNQDEIDALKPIIINGDLQKIKQSVIK